MYTGFKHLHSFLPYLLLAVLIVSIILYISKRSNGSAFSAGDKRLALITLILAHLQAVVGIVLFFISPVSQAALASDEMMSNATNRLYAIEHPLTMLIAVVLITIGYSKAKKKVEAKAKYRTLILFFALGLLLALSRIPWDVWPA